MPADELDAQRWFRNRLKEIGEQYPELKTTEQQERLARALSPEATLATGLQAAMETYQHDCAGTVPPVHMREYMLLLALQKIATGEVKIREARACAAHALALWQEQCSEDTTDGEER